ncbi:Rho termination factor N-terminal domain-containing protein [Mycolicibacterium vanbaalenii]|uniref:Rho termination factor N-terminal domain-containing protein n=1 Tax=Mycolicibacterium vanbaalenii TaxID=110539 RepID=UPI0021F306A2|nr:Rho termination factor N-terminal domain-containing protein [Mycolicibacterium vanbaalenii]
MAKEIGVEGASGMRKSELIAAIRERRGEANGKPAAKSDTAEATAAAPSGDTSAPAGDTAAQPAIPRPSRRYLRRQCGLRAGRRSAAAAAAP